jgi:hypothetical protein
MNKQSLAPGYADLTALPLRSQWGGWAFKGDRLVLKKMDYAIKFDSINSASDVLGWIVHMAGKNQKLYGESVASDLMLAFIDVLYLGTMHSCQGPIDGPRRAREYSAKLKQLSAKTQSCSPKITEISDPATIETICQLQQRFVESWNKAELNHGIGQSDALPSGAIYSGVKPDGAVFNHGATFVLPFGAWVLIFAKASWWHWHDGWSFCRNPITPADIRKVVVHGGMDGFSQWFALAQAESL